MRAAPLALWLVAAGCDRTAAEYPLGTSPDPRLGTPLYEVAGKNALAGYTWRWNTTHVPLTVEELVEDVDGNVHVVVGHGPWRQFGSLTHRPDVVVYRIVTPDGEVVEEPAPSLYASGRLDFELALMADERTPYLVESGSPVVSELMAVILRDGDGWTRVPFHHTDTLDRTLPDIESLGWDPLFDQVRAIDAERVFTVHDDLLYGWEGDDWVDIDLPDGAIQLRLLAADPDVVRALWLLDRGQWLCTGVLGVEDRSFSEEECVHLRQLSSFDLHFGWSGTVDSFTVEFEHPPFNVTMRYRDGVWVRSPVSVDTEAPWPMRLVSSPHPDRAVRSGGQPGADDHPLFDDVSWTITALYDGLEAGTLGENPDPVLLSCENECVPEEGELVVVDSDACHACVPRHVHGAAWAPKRSMDGAWVIVADWFQEGLRVYLDETAWPYDGAFVERTAEPDGDFPGDDGSAAQPLDEVVLQGVAVYPYDQDSSTIAVTVEPTGDPGSAEYVYPEYYGDYLFPARPPGDYTLRFIRAADDWEGPVYEVTASEVGLVQLEPAVMRRGVVLADFDPSWDGFVPRHQQGMVQWSGTDAVWRDWTTGIDVVLTTDLLGEPRSDWARPELVFFTEGDGSLYAFFVDDGSITRLSTASAAEDVRFANTTPVVAERDETDADGNVAWYRFEPADSPGGPHTPTLLTHAADLHFAHDFTDRTACEATWAWRDGPSGLVVDYRAACDDGPADGSFPADTVPMLTAVETWGAMAGDQEVDFLAGYGTSGCGAEGDWVVPCPLHVLQEGAAHHQVSTTALQFRIPPVEPVVIWLEDSGDEQALLSLRQRPTPGIVPLADGIRLPVPEFYAPGEAPFWTDTNGGYAYWREHLDLWMVYVPNPQQVGPQRLQPDVVWSRPTETGASEPVPGVMVWTNSSGLRHCDDGCDVGMLRSTGLVDGGVDQATGGEVRLRWGYLSEGYEWTMCPMEPCGVVVGNTGEPIFAGHLWRDHATEEVPVAAGHVPVVLRDGSTGYVPWDL